MFYEISKTLTDQSLFGYIWRRHMSEKRNFKGEDENKPKSSQEGLDEEFIDTYAQIAQIDEKSIDQELADTYKQAEQEIRITERLKQFGVDNEEEPYDEQELDDEQEIRWRARIR